MIRHCIYLFKTISGDFRDKLIQDNNLVRRLEEEQFLQVFFLLSNSCTLGIFFCFGQASQRCPVQAQPFPVLCTLIHRAEHMIISNLLTVIIFAKVLGWSSVEFFQAITWKFLSTHNKFTSWCIIQLEKSCTDKCMTDTLSHHVHNVCVQMHTHTKCTYI